MGEVYRALDPRLGREVALKFIRGGDPRLTMRLIREARAQARVEHHNVCKVFEVGEVAGKVYIAMQLVEGHPLHEAAASMSLHDKVRAIRDVALALHEAHKLGILHRDIKPSNILIEDSGDGIVRPVVVDFGIARDDATAVGLTETGAVLGTPAYMSPEQARGSGRTLDRRSDVYSVGATLHELLTGVAPFEGKSPVEIVLAVLNQDPLPLRARMRSIPQDLETIVAKCLAKEPQQRYDSAKALADDLDRYIRGDPIIGRRETRVRRLLRMAGRHKALVTTASIALVGIVVAGAVVVDTQLAARRRESELEQHADLEREVIRDVEEMEWFLRTTAMMPLHDTTPERAIIAQQMERLAARSGGSAAADALIDYAVGRGHLALHQDQRAYERFVLALEGGLDTPDLHYAFGLVLGRLYDYEREALERWADPHTIDVERERLEREYLVPAREHLHQATGSVLVSPAYVEGLLALYSQRYTEAIALAESAQQQSAWLYEARVLGGNARIAIATAKLEHGEHDQAEAEIMAALRLYETASEIARSDNSVYEAEARAWIELINHRMARGRNPDEPYRRAVLACQKAARAAPASAVAYENEVHAHSRRVAVLIDFDEDPRPIVEAALPAAERALALGSGGAKLLDQVGNLHSIQARFEMSRGIDPTASIVRAQEFHQRAIAADPGFAWAWNDFGVTEMTQGEWAMHHGGSVPEILRHLDSSLTRFERAAELDPEYVVAYSNIVYDQSLRAQVAAETGGSVVEIVEAAHRAADRAAIANAAYFNSWLNLCGAYHIEAKHRLLVGLDPRAAVDAAIEHASAAIRHHEGTLSYCVIADAHRIAGEHVLAGGGDPTREVALGLAALNHPDRACARGEHAPARARLLSIRARWRERLGPSADEAWDQAAAVLAEAAREEGDHADLLLAIAETTLHRVDSARVAGRYTDGHLLDDAVMAIERVLELRPWCASALALQGALELAKARMHDELGTGRAAAERARVALRAALIANPHLQHRYASVLAEAERLAE